MDEIRKLLRAALRAHRFDNLSVSEYPEGVLVGDILRRLEPYLKGPKIPIKELKDLAGWLQ